MFTSLAGGLLLFVPPLGHIAEWVACAVWLGLVWLALAAVWRDHSSFSVFQGAFSLAAVLCGVAWIDAQGWWPTHSQEYLKPAAWHVYAVSVGLLSVGWVFARRAFRNNLRAQQLWTGQTWSAERVLLAVLVVGQFLFAAIAIVSEAQAELTPLNAVYYRAQPPELTQLFGSGAWVMLSVFAVAVLTSWRLTGSERDTDPHVFGMALLCLSVPVVWAGTHAAELASASALRWGLGAAFALGTAAVAARTPLRRRLVGLGFPCHTTAVTRQSLLSLLAVAAGVVVFLSAEVAKLGLQGNKASGPLAESVFAAMGPLVSNLVPLVFVVFGLGISAVRERSQGYAFAGGLVFTATVAGGYALGVVTGGGTLDDTQQLRVWLLASGAAAIWAIVWRLADAAGRVPGGALLAVQSWLGLGSLAIGATIAALIIVVHPEQQASRALAELGLYGWFVLVVAAIAALGQSVNKDSLKFHVLALSALIAGVLLACAVQPWDANGGWLTFHVLAGAWALVGLVIVARNRREFSYWLDGMSAVLAVLALRGGWHDPWAPWVPATLALIASFVVGSSAVLNRCSIRAALSGLLVNFAAILLWVPTDPHTNSGFLLANAAGLAVAAIVWSRVSRRHPETNWQSILDIARGVSLLLLWAGLFSTLAGGRNEPAWLTWGATVSAVLSMVVACGTPSARMTPSGVFIASAAFVLLGVRETTQLAVWNVWQTPVALAAYSVLTSLSWATPTSGPKYIPRFLLPKVWAEALLAHAVFAVVVIGLGVRLGLRLPELEERIAASPLSVSLLLGAGALLIRDVPAWAGTLRFAVVTLCVLLGATVAWSAPDPTASHAWLHRNAWLFVALTGTGVVGTELARRLGENWRRATRSVGGICLALAVLVLGVNLTQQVPVFDPVTKRTPLEPSAVFAMLLGVFAIIVFAIRFALKRDLDPCGMPDHRRTLYVYLAEVLVVLFFTHIRFNVPELFLPGAVQYWTFAVMAIAFVVVGLAELFERRKLAVLATPLRRTGVLVPLVPLLTFWAKPPAFLTQFATDKAPGLSPLLGYLEKLPQHFDTYAWLWFLAGGLYGLVALARNSFGWALLAALATNAALWSLLTHNQIPFAVHPQAWVIPFALIVLVSEHINRARLRPDVANGLRYVGVGMIYLASSADMFVAGVGQSVWLPVILALFCVFGVLAGIMMRVRAFLFLGVGFLLLDIFAMIWHAAVDLQQTWVWYVSGIVLGVAILAIFAVFEKRKRNDEAR